MIYKLSVWKQKFLSRFIMPLLHITKGLGTLDLFEQLLCLNVVVIRVQVVVSMEGTSYLAWLLLKRNNIYFYTGSTRGFLHDYFFRDPHMF